MLLQYGVQDLKDKRLTLGALIDQSIFRAVVFGTPFAACLSLMRDTHDHAVGWFGIEFVVYGSLSLLFRGCTDSVLASV